MYLGLKLVSCMFQWCDRDRDTGAFYNSSYEANTETNTPSGVIHLVGFQLCFSLINPSIGHQIVHALHVEARELLVFRNLDKRV